jgi:glutamine amidotransferase PdxT
MFHNIGCRMTSPPVVWGTCAGMILLSDRIEHQKSGGQLKVEKLTRIYRHLPGSTTYL